MQKFFETSVLEAAQEAGADVLPAKTAQDLELCFTVDQVFNTNSIDTEE